MGARFLFTERDAATGKMTLRRGFAVAPGETAVVVEDVITTGGSTAEVIDALQRGGRRGCWRQGPSSTAAAAAPTWACRASALATLRSHRPMDPEECPLCAQGHPRGEAGLAPAT